MVGENQTKLFRELCNLKLSGFRTLDLIVVPVISKKWERHIASEQDTYPCKASFVILTGNASFVTNNPHGQPKILTPQEIQAHLFISKWL